MNRLLVLLQALQTGLLTLLHALGLTGDTDGQAAWPFGVRIAADMLRFDPGHARRVALTLGLVCAALLLLGAALFWRRRRGALAAVAVVMLALAPWPDPTLLFAPAVPTSFHRSASGFTAHSIARGESLYGEHCAACHGSDARGEGPLAARLPMWPPTLNGDLLWRRLDGELYWRVLHGMHDRHGVQTMPGFAGTLASADVWAVLDFLQANAAGQSLQREGLWPRPVRMPDLTIECDGHSPRPLRTLQGQRLRIVASAEGSASPLPDPRLMNVSLGDSAAVFPATAADCRAADRDATRALALLAGVPPAELPGHQFIVDRDGWLRARSRPGQALWSDADLICRAGPAAPTSAERAAGNGLDRLIARIDAEPVQLLRGGFPH